jgi:hypothetical protein
VAAEGLEDIVVMVVPGRVPMEQLEYLSLDVQVLAVAEVEDL